MESIWLLRAVLFLGVFSMYSSNIFLRKSEKIPGRELKEKKPEYSWVRFGFLIPYLIFVAIIFALLQIVMNALSVLLLSGAAFACIGLFYGVFTLISGVCPVPLSAPVLFFVFGDDAKRAGIFQSIWSIAVLLLAGFAYLY